MLMFEFLGIMILTIYLMIVVFQESFEKVNGAQTPTTEFERH